MRRPTVALLALVALGVASMSFAAPTTSKSMKIVGEVVSVDLTAKTFTVKEAVKSGSAKQMVFHLADTGRVMLQDKTAHLADLKVGDSVTVKYEQNAGKNVAEECTIARKAA